MDKHYWRYTGKNLNGNIQLKQIKRKPVQEPDAQIAAGDRLGETVGRKWGGESVVSKQRAECTVKFHDILWWHVVPVFELLWYGPLAITFNISLLRCSKPKYIYGKFTKSLVNNPVLTFNLEITGQIDPSLPDYDFPLCGVHWFALPYCFVSLFAFLFIILFYYWYNRWPEIFNFYDFLYFKLIKSLYLSPFQTEALSFSLQVL